ncbi:MAG: hypothetical protein N2491_11650 [Negativicutes bacterium]|nr:hypothetical protein [Negativicutes bacterium]
MRKMTIVETTVIISLLLAALFFVQAPVKPQMWLYPLARQVFQAKMNFDTRHMQKYETEHFIVKYTEQDADIVKMVADAAEKAYHPVTSILGYRPEGKAMIVVYPDKKQLNELFGWTSGESAMGVYWGGVIQVLSPQAWLKDVNSAAEFTHSGPVLHEYTHLVFDYMTSGNYSRWFTEGLAQYLEYRVNGYEWLTKDNKLTGRLYTMTQLDDRFDDLDNKSLAYRQSLAAIRYIAEVHGDDKLRAVIRDLRAGVATDKAISRNLGMSYDEYERAWTAWAAGTMSNLKK